MSAEPRNLVFRWEFSVSCFFKLKVDRFAVSRNEVLKPFNVRELEPLVRDHGLGRFGIVKLERPFSMDYYDQWLQAGLHGEMSYLERHRDAKAEPQTWLPFAKSALIFAIPYVGPSDYVTTLPLRTALYTRFEMREGLEHRDYHHELRARISPLLEELKIRYPAAEFRFAVDAEPVLERDLARRAGLGWVGKNTCILDRQGGSLFFIAEVLTSLEPENENAGLVVSKDFCGSCTRCLDACPTGALVAPRVLDATKCISYWTIESKKIPPPELRSKFGDWFFGCDICQTVCPWNGKVFGRERMEHETDPSAHSSWNREAVIEDLRFILVASGRELERRFKGTPFERARAFGLKRNAMIVAANKRFHELRKEISELQEHEKLGELARETLRSFE